MIDCILIQDSCVVVGCRLGVRLNEHVKDTGRPIFALEKEGLRHLNLQHYKMGQQHNLSGSWTQEGLETVGYCPRRSQGK